MRTITLSVPEELKMRMDQTDWVNWSSVARRAFAETLEDVAELQQRKQARAISGIDDNDVREVRQSVAQDVVKSVRKTLKQKKPPE